MIVTLDLEIEKPVEEVGGWDAARGGKAGLSIAVTSTIAEAGKDNVIHIWDRHTLAQLVSLIETCDTLVTFNGKNFDLPVISALYGSAVHPKNHYDILDEIWKALENKRYKGWGLDAVARRTIGRGKTGSGELAPALWAQKRIAEVVDYCLRDVELTEDLYFHILEVGSVIGPDEEELSLNGTD